MSLFCGLGGKGGTGTTCYRYGASWRGGWHEYVTQRDRSDGCITWGICQTPTWHTSKGEIFHRRRRSPFSNSCHVTLFGNHLLCGRNSSTRKNLPKTLGDFHRRCVFQPWTGHLHFKGKIIHHFKSCYGRHQSIDIYSIPRLY